MIVSFYFGSSRNPNTKDNTIAALVQPTNDHQAPVPSPPTTPTGFIVCGLSGSTLRLRPSQQASQMNLSKSTGSKGNSLLQTIQ
jgi:hypothetical protein